MTNKDVVTDLVVAGGGCFGSYHTRQLVKAIQRGRLHANRVLVVDRRSDCPAAVEFASNPLVELVVASWVEFLVSYTATFRGIAAHLVPPPIGPHVALEWMRQSMSAALGPVVIENRPLLRQTGLPFEWHDDQGNSFFSHAAWRCPANCYEPAICPATGRVRDWSMPETIEVLLRRQVVNITDVFVFHSKHLVFGVATMAMAELLAARERVLARAREGNNQRVLVATVSHCHGVLGMLDVPPQAR